MRLWHKDLIPVLPDKWLVAQWRELSAISGRLNLVGSPQHALVNKLTQYEWQHFAEYTFRVYDELVKRGVHIQQKVYDKIISQSKKAFDKFTHRLIVYNDYQDLFYGWHTDRYLNQCFYNLQEKYDCGLLTHGQYLRIKEQVQKVLDNNCV